MSEISVVEADGHIFALGDAVEHREELSRLTQTLASPGSSGRGGSPTPWKVMLIERSATSE